MDAIKVGRALNRCGRIDEEITSLVLTTMLSGGLAEAIDKVHNTHSAEDISSEEKLLLDDLIIAGDGTDSPAIRCGKATRGSA